MATPTTTAHPTPTPAPSPDADRDRALALRRRLLPLAAAWALLVCLPPGWIVLGELADSVTRHGAHRLGGPWWDGLGLLFLLLCLAPCVASIGLSLLAWHRGADVGRRRVHLLLPGGLAGGVIAWAADQVQRGPVLGATALLVAALALTAGLLAARGDAGRTPAPGSSAPSDGRAAQTPAATSRQRASTSE